MQYYRYRNDATKQIEYVNSAGIPTLSLNGDPIVANSITYIKDSLNSSGGGGILTYYINLVGNNFANINNALPIGSYTITIKKQSPMDEAPSSSFNISKISSLVDANVNDVNNVQSITSGEKLYLQWLSGGFLQCKKDTSPPSSNSTFNGIYIVNII